MIKYIVAMFGAVLVFIGAVPCVLILGGFLGFLSPDLYRGGIGPVVLWGVALLLAVLAGGHSFRATLRMYGRTKDKTGPE